MSRAPSDSDDLRVVADTAAEEEVAFDAALRPKWLQEFVGQDRIKEAAKLGFQKLIVPKGNAPKGKTGEAEIITVERVDQAVQVLRNL